MNRQECADAVDQEMAARLLPGAAVTALGRWWKENAATYTDGTPGAHTIRYTPSRWAQITPWPSGLAHPSPTGDAGISRAEVALAVADALRREAFREALVATYVWGKGKRGTPRGSGPVTLQRILDAEGLDAALALAVSALDEHGSRLTAHGSRLTAHGSRLTAHGRRTRCFISGFPNSGRPSSPSSCTSQA